MIHDDRSVGIAIGADANLKYDEIDAVRQQRQAHGQRQQRQENASELLSQIESLGHARDYKPGIAPAQNRKDANRSGAKDELRDSCPRPPLLHRRTSFGLPRVATAFDAEYRVIWKCAAGPIATFR